MGFFVTIHTRAGLGKGQHFFAVLFAKQKTKFGGGKAKADENSFFTPPNPLYFYPSERGGK